VRFPYIHDLAQLLALVEGTGQSVSESIKQAARLTEYAVATRYPELSEPVMQREYEEAIVIAEETVHWAQEVIERKTG
jgi:HEPN domain-containing protein